MPDAPTLGASRAVHRKRIDGVDLSPDDRVSLYAHARQLNEDLKRKCGLLIPFTTYFQDPFVAARDPKQGLNEKVLVAWEPGLTDGPTSSRFAIVDYNSDTNTLEPPAVWSEPAQAVVDAQRHDARGVLPEDNLHGETAGDWEYRASMPGHSGVLPRTTFLLACLPGSSRFLQNAVNENSLRAVRTLARDYEEMAGSGMRERVAELDRSLKERFGRGLADEATAQARAV